MEVATLCPGALGTILDVWCSEPSGKEELSELEVRSFSNQQAEGLRDSFLERQGAKLGSFCGFNRGSGW